MLSVLYLWHEVDNDPSEQHVQGTDRYVAPGQKQMKHGTEGYGTPQWNTLHYVSTEHQIFGDHSSLTQQINNFGQ
jgi:hypothetical protein